MFRRIAHKDESIAWSGGAKEYAEAHRKFADMQYGAFVKDMKALNLSGHYLEVGAGPGFLAIMIAEDNPDVRITAVDISPEMAAVAQEYIEKKDLQDRIRYLVGDATDEEMISGLGKFDLVYSAFSLHHWKEPEQAIGNLWGAVGDKGVLYVQDFKRVWWLYVLPIKDGFIESVRASYTPGEVKAILQKVGISEYKVKTSFPFFMQSIMAWK